MKYKKVIIAVAIIVGLILLTIVGFTIYKKVVNNEGLLENSTKVFSQIYLNTKNLKSYDMDINVSLAGISDNKTNLQVDLNNQVTKNTMTTKVNDVPTTVETYQQYSNKEIVVYTNGVFSDTWLKQTTEIKGDNQNMIDENEYLKCLEKFDNIKKLKSDKKGYNKYEIIVNASNASDLVTSDVAIDKNGKLIATIYTDKEYIKSITYKLESDSLKFNVKINYNKINIKLTIPDEVTKNAKTIDEINVSSTTNIEATEEALKNSGIDNVDYQKIMEEVQTKMNSQEAQQQLQQTQETMQQYIGSEQHQQQIQQSQDLLNSMLGH